MNNPNKLAFLALLLACLTGCFTASKGKSADYYRENKAALEDLRNQYEKLYSHQPFSAGFTDKSYSYFTMEVNTDTVRYIYNTKKNSQQVAHLIDRFDYDTAQLRAFAIKMKELKCLWLSKSTFFVNEERETVTFLSFDAAAGNKPFVEQKYYILIFLNHPIVSQDIKKRIKKGTLVKIEELVYYRIGNGYR
jgi:hypothetical protein